MGIYIFSMNLWREILQADHADGNSGHDFGHDILPTLIQSHRLCAYQSGKTTGRVTPDNYWRDVGSIDSFYEANMDLLEPVPALNLYRDDWPIRTCQLQPPARTVPGASGSEGISINSIVAGGSVQHSILFPGVHVGDEAVVRDAILFNGVKVGNNAQLRNCIIDKEAYVPVGESIGLDLDRYRERFTVSPGGIVVVPEHYRFG